MVEAKELGLRLHVLRFVRGIRLADVEEATGIPKSTLSRWEKPARSDRFPPANRLDRLASFYGISISELLDPDYDTRVRFNVARARAA